MELTNELLTILLDVEENEYTEQYTEQQSTEGFWYNVLEQFEAYSLNDEPNHDSGILL